MSINDSLARAASVTSLDDAIDFFNEEIAGNIRIVTGDVLHTPKIDKNNPS